MKITKAARMLTTVKRLRSNDGFVFGLMSKNNPQKIAKTKIAVMLFPIQWCEQMFLRASFKGV